MPGVPRELAEHHLNLDPLARPIKQPLRRFSEPNRKAMLSEINRLREAGFIKEIFTEATWVANPVMVPKKNTKVLRMCVDFTCVNKHCPKDHFPLPRIDQIIDSTAGCERLSFLDAYSGYNQIRLKEEDEVKTAFITPYGVFCYRTMPFGLKNAGATYQRMMQKCLATQIGKNVQVYIDDVVITSKKGATLIEDLKETFDNLDKFCLKLNPTKCSFGVPAGELLGFLVSARGIEANPDKIQAIVTMRKPTKLKEIQQLTGRVAALSRFVARLGEKALPFYALIKQGDKFQWNEEADRAFEDLKRTISTPPILVAPKEKEPLLLYIAATPQVVSTVLVVEREEEGKLHGVQRPVYFISEVLSPSKQRYPQYQKLAYGVIATARKLRHYFSAHPIIVVNEAPLSNILNNPEATGRVSLWGIELSPRDITYEKRKAIKSQVLPDFIAEWMELQNTGPPDLSRTWTMNFDGSKRVEGAGAGVVLISPEGDKLKYVLRMTFPNASNNEAEYEALIHGMKMAKACGATRLKIFGDSQLVAQQVMNQCDAVNDSMMAYKEVYNELEKLFDGCEVNHISRLSNDEADVLANIGSQCLPIPPGVFWEEIAERSTKPKKVQKKAKEEKTSTPLKETTEDEEDQELVMMVQIPWMQAYISYIIRKEIPDDPVEARRVIRRSKAFTVIKGELYKRSISGVLQRCVTPEEGRIILKDVHEGICGHHASSRAIAAKVFRAGFYWLTAIEDAKEIVRTCDACQRFAAKPHSPAAELTPIPLSWPFAQWGLDMVGKLHKASPGGYEYLLVAVDKFTKWIEAKPINSPDAASAIKFVKDIVFRFGVPHSIVTDNGSNFTSKEFKAYCAEVGIKLHFASVAHPQTNGQVEKANGIICNGIKKRLLGPLEKARHTWPEELPSVLWSIRTTPNTATQETPFFLVHGAEAVLPIEIEHDSPRVTEYNEEASRKALEDDVDALDEARDEVLSRVTKYQQDLKNYHSRRLRPRSFQVGDLVLRLNQERTEKLESPWLGPYVVTEVIDGGAYRIKDKKTGVPEKNPWNVAQLRRFYA